MENKSIWEMTTSIERRKELQQDIKCDILIVGAGLAGVLTGYFLSKQNNNVVIIDKDTIGSGVSKNTTAKITFQQGLIYHKLLKTIGYNKTKLFYQANLDALKKYEELITKEGIECDFKNEPSYIYSLKPSKKIKNEYKAYRKLEIEGEIVNKTSLPFNVDSALKVKNQASFNPLKFIDFLSRNLTIYENTKMVRLDEDGSVFCDSGYTIKANKIIIATHFPILDEGGFYFLKQYQKKSYLLALENANPVNGLYLDEQKNGYTLRDYKNYVLFGGYSHKTGIKEDSYYFKKLEEDAKKFFPNSSIVAKFSTQDCISLDHMPYIGRYSKKSNNVYVATGFNKWGMTASMLSAMILTDLINNKNNKYSKLFSPSRLNFISSIPNITHNSLNSIHGLFLKRILIKRKEVIELENDSSTIIKYNKKYVGIYKDINGEVFAIDIRCPHLGCILSFNKEERAYECPCHGSKFDYKGKLIYSPSMFNTRKHKL